MAAERKKKSTVVVKQLLIGDSSIGKTSLLLRYDENTFSTRYTTTIGVDYRDKVVVLDGEKTKVQVWDTAGQERFRALTTNFFGRADGFILCYDCTSRKTFENVRGWMEHINEFGKENAPSVLCATKCDLESKREVSREEGGALAREFAIDFMESSALANINVEPLFNNLAIQVKARWRDQANGIIAPTPPARIRGGSAVPASSQAGGSGGGGGSGAGGGFIRGDTVTLESGGGSERGSSGGKSGRGGCC